MTNTQGVDRIMTGLGDIREKWESSALCLYHDVAEIGPKYWEAISVIVSGDRLFTCLRYFTIGEEWSVSVDRDKVHIAAMMEWLMTRTRIQ